MRLSLQRMIESSRAAPAPQWSAASKLWWLVRGARKEPPIGRTAFTAVAVLLLCVNSSIGAFAQEGGSVGAEEDRQSGLVCWTMRDDAASALDAEQYGMWIDREVQRLVLLLDAHREEAPEVLVELCTAPGGVYTSGPHAGEARMLYEEEWNVAFRSAWKRILVRLQEDPALWGVNLFHGLPGARTAESRARWGELVVLTERRVHSYRPETLVVVEPVLGDPAELDPSVFTPPTQRANVLYGACFGSTGEFPERAWSDSLARRLSAVRRFRSQFGLPVFDRQFGAVPWEGGLDARRLAAWWDATAGLNSNSWYERGLDCARSFDDLVDAPGEWVPLNVQPATDLLHSWFDRLPSTHP